MGSNASLCVFLFLLLSSSSSSSTSSSFFWYSIFFSIFVFFCCRAASRVRTRQAWHAAVRHTGLLFQLPAPPSPSANTPPAAAAAADATSLSKSDPPRSAGSSGGEAPNATHAEGSEEEDGAACLEAAAELPYPQLAQTVSSASFAPAAHLAEHYSPPGGAHPSCLCTVLLYMPDQWSVHQGLRIKGKQGWFDC